MADAGSHLHKPRNNSSDIENAQSFDLAYEYPPYTSVPDLVFTPNYQFDDLLSSTLIPSKAIDLDKERLDSCVQYFKNYLTHIVQYGRTPFINPDLYNDALPPCLQDVYCICAAYVSKTANNETLVFQILSSKFDELVLKRRQYCSFEDELASLQAFIIYQIIRLFDGDIRQRGIAEAQFRTLDAWAIHLRQRSEFELVPSIQSSPYLKWLSIESVRRTVLMSIFLRAIYYTIKDGFCDQVPAMAGLPLTVRGELWEVKSEGEWMQATRGSQPDVLTYHDWVGVWDGGRAAGDVEGFQRMLLVGCIGEEGMQSRFFESLTRDVGWT